MAAVAFDSMALLRELEDTGMERRQAEGVVSAIKRVHDIQMQETSKVTEQLELTVTFKDQVRQQMHDGFEQINKRFDEVGKKLASIDLKFAEVETRFAKTDANIELLRKDLDAQPNKIIIRLTIAIAAMLGLLFAALRYLPAS